jgi:hypothetical protein
MPVHEAEGYVCWKFQIFIVYFYSWGKKKFGGLYLEATFCPNRGKFCKSLGYPKGRDDDIKPRYIHEPVFLRESGSYKEEMSRV